MSDRGGFDAWNYIGWIVLGAAIGWVIGQIIIAPFRLALWIIEWRRAKKERGAMAGYTGLYDTYTNAYTWAERR